ncbi:IS200/IS605 family transposase [Donghicola eburneus]|uniref:IS200/IS605 family transposase n=1 Tax=Donghicola eburneus TaxID=393278 RepID=UPI000B89DECE
MSLQAYTSTHNCIYALRYHMVLVTKYRRRVLTGHMLDAARDVLDARASTQGGRIEEFGGEEDHIHLLVSLPPAVPVSIFANAAKTGTSRRLRRDFPQLKKIGPALWSPSYFVTSCGGAPLETIKEYVRSQARPD